MERQVECLSCGHQRVVVDKPDECPRCRYLGWAPADEVSEALRGSLRGQPLASRRFEPQHERQAS